MRIPVLMPQLGESVGQVTVERWLKRPGEHVRPGEPLAEVATDKVSADIPASAAGTLMEVLVEEGQPVPVGTPIAIVEAAEAEEQASSAPAPEDDTELMPLTAIRRTIASRMAEAKRTIPHAWMMVECDVTGLCRLRQSIREEFRRREGFDLTYLPFFAQAVVRGLKACPDLNARWTESGIVRYRQIRLGIAVARDEGLVVPVLPHAEGLTIAALARAIWGLVERARKGKLSVEDVQGGTFTINNTGALGSIASAPIINPPQAAIATLEAVVRRPVAFGEGIAIRDMVNVCCSFDHRIVDGSTVGRFLQVVKGALEAFGPGDPIF